jgi:GT2 family glycosyltransferase
MSASRSEMKMSIIVATHNRCESVRMFLSNLKNLCLPGALECEVLMVDNNSTDATKQVVTDYAVSRNPAVRYLFEQRQGKSSALNTGIREAEGDILAFTDDDCVPDQYWIASIVKEFREDPSLSVLGGRVELYNKNDISHSISLSKKRIHICHHREIFLQPKIMGGNMVFRRIVFNGLSGFDTLLGPGTKMRAAEDLDILWRLYKKQFKMVYSPDVLVFHNHGRKTQAEDNALTRAYGIGRGAVYCKHILQSDTSTLKIAGAEIYGLCKTLLKSLFIGENVPYHKITLPSLFLGALYYCEASLFKGRILKGYGF